MDSPQPASQTDIESSGSPASVCSTAVVDPEIWDKLSEPQQDRLQALVDAMKRCVQGHDYTKEQFLAYPTTADLEAVIGIKQDEESQWKKDTKNELVETRAHLHALFPDEGASDHQVPEDKLETLMCWLCRVATAMFGGLEKELGHDDEAITKWRGAICQAADPGKRCGYDWDSVWPEDVVCAFIGVGEKRLLAWLRGSTA